MTARLLAGLASAVVRILAATWRLEVVGNRNVLRLRSAGIPVVFAVWHAHLLAPLWHRRHEGITLLVSDHGDAGHLAGSAVRWGYRVVRGSSTRGGVRGLLGLMRTLASGRDVAIAPDGPRGPAKVPKPGVLAAAARARAAIVPVGAWASSSWRFNSWDGFLVPRPFARVRVVYDEPLKTEIAVGEAKAFTGLVARRLDSAQERAAC